MRFRPEKPLPQIEERYRHGDAQMKVPDVVGADLATASAVLREAGYQVTTVPVSSPQPPGAVVAQSPRGVAFRGTPVTLSVRTGPPPPATSAPPATSTSAPPTS